MSDDEDRPLPPGIKAALDRVANGQGRVATAAHPDCICGKPIPGVSPRDRKKDCPQHN